MRASDAIEVLLVLHDQTAKAYRVSANNNERESFWLPKSLALKSEPIGGFERWGRNCQRKLNTIHEFCVPRFVAEREGLAA
jgi:hypothetical protein